MQKPEFEALCRGIKEGEERFVEDETFHKTGKVIGCSGNHFTVDTEGKQQSWPSETCRERMDLKSGSK